MRFYTSLNRVVVTESRISVVHVSERDLQKLYFSTYLPTQNAVNIMLKTKSYFVFKFNSSSPHYAFINIHYIVKRCNNNITWNMFLWMLKGRLHCKPDCQCLSGESSQYLNVFLYISGFIKRIELNWNE